MDTPFEIWWTINTANSCYTDGHLLEDHGDELTWYERAALEDGAKVTGAQYAGALGRRDALKAQMADLFERYDLLLSPTMPVTAMPVGEYPKDMGDVNAHPYFWRFLPFTHPINTIGHPAAAVPCGFDSDGLHIVGPARRRSSRRRRPSRTPGPGRTSGRLDLEGRRPGGPSHPGLLGGQAAVDHQLAARHEGRLVGGEIQRSVGDVLRCP